MSLVELKDVVKSYGQNQVLKGVSLTVEKGEIIAIIGRSGSGKSTMLRCVNGLEPIQGGSVSFEGTKVNDPATDLRKLRQHVGIVFQSFNLFPHLSVEKNITLARWRTRCCARSGWPRRSMPIPTSSRAASSSAWRSRGLWPCSQP
jgi:polar amino acid transport system ATP-binding protein